jgi:hypothetical protein
MFNHVLAKVTPSGGFIVGKAEDRKRKIHLIQVIGFSVERLEEYFVRFPAPF